jgi:hypothetical protein
MNGKDIVRKGDWKRSEREREREFASRERGICINFRGIRSYAFLYNYNLHKTNFSYFL